jgi:membrane-associated phospholipid phosphatase
VSPLSRRTLLGLLGIAFGTIGFVLQADAVDEGDGLAAFDPQLTANVAAERTAGLTKVAQAFSFLGSAWVLTTLTVIVAVLLRVLTRRWLPALVLVVGMVGSSILTYLLKVLIGRQRPDASMVVGTVSDTFSFPSGHSLNSAVFFGLLAGMLWYSSASRTIKILGTAVAVLLTVGVGWSRVYLGYHWATDVLAGWTVALTWLCVLATAVHLIGARRSR